MARATDVLDPWAWCALFNAELSTDITRSKRSGMVSMAQLHVKG